MMHANSEVGHHPARRARSGAITREHGIPFHVDGVQTFGKVPDRLDAFGIDLLSFSGHKIYGPKGVAGSTSARAPRWSPSSTAASTSGAGARARRT